MVIKRIWLGMLVIALVFGMTVIGCDNTGGIDDPKTLVVRNIPANVYAYANYYSQLGVYPTGTTTQQAISMTGLVAGAYLTNSDISVAGSGPYTVTIPLYNVSGNTRWIGNGTYDIYVRLGSHYYKANSVNISSGTTTISFSDTTEVFP